MKTDSMLVDRVYPVLSVYYLLILFTNCTNYKPKETLVILDSNSINSSEKIANASIAFAVNAGGTEYKAANGITYQADNNFSGGFSHQTNTAIVNTEDPTLYQTGHFGSNFTYSIPLDNGIYNITFGFIENYNSTSSSRQFDILAEGREIISNLDIFNVAGKNKVYLVNQTVTVKDDTLNLKFRGDKGDAMISAFHIRRKTVKANHNSEPIKTVNFAVNGGGTTFKASNGIVYEEDNYFSGGFSHHVTTAISNTSDDSLYQVGHYGTNFSYNVPLANGTYDITIHFAENYNSSSGTRQFDVFAEGIEIVHNLDIYNVVGKGKAYSLTKTASLKDGIMNLNFKADKGDAMVSAFYITEKY